MKTYWKLVIPITLIVLVATVLGACVPAPPPAAEPPVEEVAPPAEVPTWWAPCLVTERAPAALASSTALAISIPLPTATQKAPTKAS
ncbi:hypothetical protein HKBW3C_03048, partial [Candidatus Hakubella thermalkaliphila]